MQTSKTQFHVGDWIVHAFYGIGKIVDKEKMKLSGKVQTFFTVKLKDGKYWLSKNKSKAQHVRPLATIQEMEKALQEVERKPQGLPKQFRSRKKDILEIIEKGSLIDNARLLRDLNGRKAKNKLNFEDRNWFAKIKKQFIREWSLVSGKKKSTLKKKLNHALAKSAKQLKEID